MTASVHKGVIRLVARVPWEQPKRLTLGFAHVFPAPQELDEASHRAAALVRDVRSLRSRASLPPWAASLTGEDFRTGRALDLVLRRMAHGPLPHDALAARLIIKELGRDGAHAEKLRSTLSTEKLTRLFRRCEK